MKYLIFVSLIIFSFKNTLDLIMHLGFIDNYNGLVLFLEATLVLLPIIQIYGMKKNANWLWSISLLQCGLIYFSSQGTFGYLVSYILKPLSSFQPVQSYVVLVCIIIAEIAKTIWFHKESNKNVSI